MPEEEATTTTCSQPHPFAEVKGTLADITNNIKDNSNNESLSSAKHICDFGSDRFRHSQNDSLHYCHCSQS